MRTSRSLLVAALTLAVWMTAQIAIAAPTPKIQQVSQDPFTNVDSQHQTQVEPDTFWSGDTIVAAFQSGRFQADGGSSGISFATSTNRGRTWTTGHIPSLTVNSTPAGSFGRATDPSVAYDAAHDTWLISAFALDPDAMVVSRSTDGGLNWSAPVTVFTAGANVIDKDWIVCDNWDSSPFRGRCYHTWTDITANTIAVSRSTDGGLSWTVPVAATGGLGVQPVVQPDGDLVIVANGPVNMQAVRSGDGGVSFGAATTVSNVLWNGPPGLRNLPLPSVEVDGSGRIYVVWEDCRFRSVCNANDVVLKTSVDGVNWPGGPSRVPIRIPNSNADDIMPGIGVDPETSGGTAKLAITFYELPDLDCTPAPCRLNVGFISSKDGGATWSAPTIPLNPVPMDITWLPDTTSGRMLADYISTSVNRSQAVTVIPIASAPSGATFHQSMFAYKDRVSG